MEVCLQLQAPQTTKLVREAELQPCITERLSARHDPAHVSGETLHFTFRILSTASFFFLSCTYQPNSCRTGFVSLAY